MTRSVTPAEPGYRNWHNPQHHVYSAVYYCIQQVGVYRMLVLDYSAEYEYE